MAAPTDDLGFVPDAQAPAPVAGSDFGFVPDAQTAVPTRADAMPPLDYSMADAGAGFVPSPSNPETAQTAKTLAPVVINGVLTTAGGAGGAALGTLAAPGAGTVAGGAAGSMAGNYVGQRINKALGFTDKVHPGEVVASGILGAFPGASESEAGVGALVRAGVKSAAGADTALTAQSLIDQGKLPTLTQVGLTTGMAGLSPVASKVLDVNPASTTPRTPAELKLAAFKLANANGIAIDPNAVNSSFPNRVLGSVGGKADTAAAFSIKNAPAVNDLGVRAMGLPSGTQLTPDTIDQAIKTAQAPYAAIRSISPQADQAMDDLQLLKYDAANLKFKYDNSEPGVSLRKNPRLEPQMAQANLDVANKINDISQMAAAAGQPQLAQQFSAANVQLAKIGEVENAFDPMTGILNVSKLTKRMDDGAPLTGELATLATIGKHFAPYVKANAVNPGSNKLTPVLAAQAAYEGVKAAGPVGAIAGAIPFSDKAARALAGSRVWQNNMVAPYAPQNIQALAARYGVMNISQAPANIPAYLQPTTGQGGSAPYSP